MVNLNIGNYFSLFVKYMYIFSVYFQKGRRDDMSFVNSVVAKVLETSY